MLPDFHFHVTITIMREIINVSLSARANHLNTQFYNIQEARLYQAGGFDLSVYANPSLSLDKKTKSYSPRLMLWDMKNGFGSLNLTETYDESLANRSQGIYSSRGVETWGAGMEQVNVVPSRPKSSYQIAMDNLQITPGLNLDNTKYWSDYNRMIYGPKLFNLLRNWEYDPVKYPQGKLRHLEDSRKAFDFALGQEEWHLSDFNLDYLDDKFRYFLEQCDNLAGLNIVCESDTGWGGIYSELVPYIKDEFLGKNSIFTWGESAYSFPRGMQLLTKINTTLAMVDNSSVVLPLQFPGHLPESFMGDSTRQELEKSLWYQAGLHSLAYDTVMSLFSNLQYTMLDLTESLTRGGRNFVTSVEVAVGSNDDFIDGKQAQVEMSGIDTPEDKVLLRNVVSSSGGADYDESTVIDKYAQFPQLQGQYQMSLQCLRSYHNEIPFIKTDTFPAQINIDPTNQTVAVNLSMSLGGQKMFKNYAKQAQRMLRKNSDEKEEMVEKLETLAAKYSSGYQDDSDEEW